MALDPADVCEDPARPTPCAVTVTLNYQFHLLVQFNIEMLGTHWGLPSSIGLRVTAPLRSRISKPRCRRSLRCRHPRPHRPRRADPTVEPTAEPTVEPTPVTRARTRSRGQALVEFALLAPVFFLVLFAIIEAGRFMFYYEALNNATRQGARYAIVNGANSLVCPTGPPAPGSTPCDTTAATSRARPRRGFGALGLGVDVTSME